MTPHDVLKNPRLAILALLSMRGVRVQDLCDLEQEDRLLTTFWLDYVDLCQRHKLKRKCSAQDCRLAFHELRYNYMKTLTLERFMV